MTLPSLQAGFFIDENDLDFGSSRTLTTGTGDFVNGMPGSPVFGNSPDGPSSSA